MGTADYILDAHYQSGGVLFQTDFFEKRGEVGGARKEENGWDEARYCLEFYDISGRSLGTSMVTLRNGSNSIPLYVTGLKGKRFPSGIYLMHIVTPDGVTVRRFPQQR